jgi:hypothetical protein
MQNGHAKCLPAGYTSFSSKAGKKSMSYVNLTEHHLVSMHNGPTMSWPGHHLFSLKLQQNWIPQNNGVWMRIFLSPCLCSPWMTKAIL